MRLTCVSLRLRDFYPRPPRGGRPSHPGFPGARFIISIHALREEGDGFIAEASKSVDKFLSTPSARRATKDYFTSCLPSPLFLSTPSARRATSLTGGLGGWGGISIHALREEGDSLLLANSPFSSLFLSTPSARRATCIYFVAVVITLLISIHALREEGDQQSRKTKQENTEFLSTPSARRATAKTERKHPAFVSLYTSLHKLQRDACKTNRKITPLLAQTAGIPVRSVPENHVCCRFALAGHQKISTLSCANSGCSPMCSTLVW